LLVANPNADVQEILIQLFLETGERVTAGPIPIQAGQRATFCFGDGLCGANNPLASADRPLVNGKSFAIKVISTRPNLPVVAQETIYFAWDAANYWRAGGTAKGIPGPQQ